MGHDPCEFPLRGFQWLSQLSIECNKKEGQHRLFLEQDELRDECSAGRSESAQHDVDNKAARILVQIHRVAYVLIGDRP